MSSVILVPLDGSALAEGAVRYAQRLASAGGRLVLARIVAPDRRPAEFPSVREHRALAEAEVYLDQVAIRLRIAGVKVEAQAVPGDASDELLCLAEQLPADLIVLGTHGRSGVGRWLYGSVADEMLRNTRIPMLLVPHTARPPWPEDRAPRILAMLDGSELAEAILEPVLNLPTLGQADLILLQIVEWPRSSIVAYEGGWVGFDPEQDLETGRAYLEDVAERLRPSVGSVVTRVELGSVPEQVARIAREAHADLMALATHGRSGLGRLVLGGTAAGVVQRAEVPVLLVRPVMSAATGSASQSSATPQAKLAAVAHE
jgi:nucleotide-binding universal stress UspA family protein